jgi:hypothetical protein
VRTRAERLNGLGRAIGARRYLEIGVEDGTTFRAVEVPVKVGVDPRLRFDPATVVTADVHLHAIGSDAFFAGPAAAYPAFDLIYLDGLHTFGQTLRDLVASLSWAHRGTVWVIDDTCPASPTAALPSLAEALREERRLGLRSGGWTGDVFKVVCAVHDLFPQLDWRTFPNHGQTVLWFHPRAGFAPRWGSLAAIEALSFADFEALAGSVFARTPAEAIVEAVRCSRPPT